MLFAIEKYFALCKNKKFLVGFTLIELLVVIAIIGILASITLITVVHSRLSAKDARIKTALYEVRNAAEMDYNVHLDYDTVCNDDGTLSDGGEFGKVEADVMKSNGNLEVNCYESADKQAYAVSSPLVSETGKCWCVSSVGNNKEIDCVDFTPGTTICP